MRQLHPTLPLLVFTLAIQLPVAAQDSTVLVAPAVSGLGQGIAQLPVDRIADLLALLPGVASLNDGSLSVRAAGVAGNDAYLDGVPIAPGLRRFKPILLGGSWYGASGIGVSLGTNAFDSLTLQPHQVIVIVYGNGSTNWSQYQTMSAEVWPYPNL